mmetsp:Transcript_130750/g.226223  ORF Transcript_130750/g.226223 Transcript_130750/m.226223 type:complete len:97 (-) Transcript_130750:1353-1643(-)
MEGDARLYQPCTYFLSMLAFFGLTCHFGGSFESILDIQSPPLQVLLETETEAAIHPHPGQALCEGCGSGWHSRRSSLPAGPTLGQSAHIFPFFSSV